MQALEASLLWVSSAASQLAWEQALVASLLWASSAASGLADEQALEAYRQRLAIFQSCTVAWAFERQVYPQRASRPIRLS